MRKRPKAPLDSAPVAAVVFIAVLFVVCIFGYGKNIYKLTQCDFSQPYKAEVIRTVGIVVPIVGTIAGYTTINDGVEVSDVPSS